MAGSNQYNVTSFQSTPFTNLHGIAADAFGNAYISDYNRIWRLVIATGGVSVVAGSGSAGFADGIGTNASFIAAGIAVDTNGNAFIPDEQNNRIRQIVLATGVTSTLAGNGVYSFADGIGSNARFSQPIGITVDSGGNLFVADYGAYRIRKIVISTALVSTLAGSGANSIQDGVGASAAFSYLRGIVVDAVGNLYVSDNNRIRMVNIASRLVSTLGSNALISGPRMLALDISGSSLFVAEAHNNRILQISVSTQSVTSAAGNGASASVDGIGSSASFQFCLGVAVDISGNILVTDYGSSRLRMLQSFSACQVGQYCPPGSASAATCPIGSFCASTGMSAPTVCTMGTYCSTSGMNATVPCTSGSYCPTGSNASNACPAGSFCANASSIASCLAGSYCPARSTAASLCSVGYYCNATGLSAVAGSCISGYYCPSGSSSPTQVACSAGFYCGLGSLNAFGFVLGPSMFAFWRLCLVLNTIVVKSLDLL
jgi:sugar lactone lactonase YvrE